VRTTASAFMESGIVMTDLLMSGVLPKYPGLRFNIVESGLGWAPFVLETLDDHFDKYQVFQSRPEFKELPSFYFRQQVSLSYWYEKLQDWHLDAIPADNILFETDYPHPTCLIGDEIASHIESGLGHQTAEVRDKVLYQNAARVFGLTVDSVV
jgi:predicted TIM-barrel fold metal-dependent hydrolase